MLTAAEMESYLLKVYVRRPSEDEHRYTAFVPDKAEALESHGTTVLRQVVMQLRTLNNSCWM